MSDTNRVAVRIAEEVTAFGVTEENPEFQDLRITGAPDLAFSPVTVVSEELRSDRNRTDLILVGADAGGGVGFELSYESLDILLTGALFSTWQEQAHRYNITEDSVITEVTATDYTVTTGKAFAEGHLIRASGFSETGNNKLFPALTGSGALVAKSTGLTVEAAPPAGARLRVIGFQGASGDIAATATGLSSTALDFTTLGLTKGQWVKIGGTAALNQFATIVLNDFARITAIVADAITLDNLPAGWTTDTGTGKEIMVFTGDYMINGVTKRSYTIEEEFSDHDPVTYQYFNGMVVSTLSLSIASQSVVGGSIAFMGTKAVIQDSARFAGATTIAAPSNTVLNSSSNVGRISEGGSAITGKNYVLESSIEINNTLRLKPAVGVLGAIGIGAGECAVSGTINTYFDDKTMVDKVINNTETALTHIFKDNDNHVVLFDFPKVKYASGSPTVPGKNQDTTVSLGYEALYSPTFGYTMSIQRFYEIQ